jgi:hypothetical protein
MSNEESRPRGEASQGDSSANLGVVVGVSAVAGGRASGGRAFAFSFFQTGSALANGPSIHDTRADKKGHFGMFLHKPMFFIS